jgi:hypothetical protein
MLATMIKLNLNLGVFILRGVFFITVFSSPESAPPCDRGIFRVPIDQPW